MDGQIRPRTVIPVMPKPRDETPQTMFQHFASEEERQKFIQDVEAGIERGETPF